MMSANYFLAAGIILSSLSTPVFADGSSAGQAKKQQSGFYGLLSIGLSDMNGTQWEKERSNATNYEGDISTESGFTGEVGAGYDFGDFRTDFTFEKSRVDLGGCTQETVSGAGKDCSTNSENVETKSLMLNAYYDIPTNSKWSPYLGAGIGITNYRVKNLKVAGTEYELSSKKTPLTYQLKAGVAYRIMEKTDVYTEGVYKMIDSFNTNTNSANNEFNIKDGSQWSAKLGLRYMF